MEPLERRPISRISSDGRGIVPSAIRSKRSTILDLSSASIAKMIAIKHCATNADAPVPISYESSSGFSTSSVVEVSDSFALYREQATSSRLAMILNLTSRLFTVSAQERDDFES